MFKKAFTLAEILITLGVIGVVAAITIPGLVNSYKKKVVETKLKHSYSIINQAVKLSVAENDEVSGWDFSLPVEDFLKKYFTPYIKADVKTVRDSNNEGVIGNIDSALSINGTQFLINRYKVSPSDRNSYYFLRISVDVNGTHKPNIQGVDRFNFYIVPVAKNVYNTGQGDCLHYVPSEGVYYDGYGFSDAEIRSEYWRGCDGKEIPAGASESKNSFCIALIVRNNWKIPKDYPFKTF